MSNSLHLTPTSFVFLLCSFLQPPHSFFQPPHPTHTPMHRVDKICLYLISARPWQALSGILITPLLHGSLLCSCSTQQIGQGSFWDGRAGISAVHYAAGARSRTSFYMKVPPYWLLLRGLDQSWRLITAFLIWKDWGLRAFLSCPTGSIVPGFNWGKGTKTACRANCRQAAYDLECDSGARWWHWAAPRRVQEATSEVR